MDIENYIGDRLLQLCKVAKMSRYQLSQKTGISQSALSDIIKKKTIPTVFTLDKICTAFGITIAQYFASDGTLPDLSEEQTEILNLWKSLSPEGKKFIKNCMMSMIKEE